MIDSRLDALKQIKNLEEAMPLDSGEYDYTPGLGSGLIPIATAAGYTKIYDQATAGNAGFAVATPNTPGRAFRIRSVKLESTQRSTEDAPILALEIRNSSDVATHVPYTAENIQRRKKIVCPVDGKLYVKTDISGRVSWDLDIEEIPP